MTFAVMANTPGVLATDAMIPDCFTIMIAFQAFATAIAVSVSRMTYSLATGAGTATVAVTRTVTAATTFCIGRGHWE
ncbi:hypothetical protein BK658_26445 [Pseudomonas brassicacearum]|uniref:Uncharacterized protein n=1 Tax=Pseudomonas brassicacearum TaxID=930166 RepID=A0A423GJA6_9PSED|nr:hypothetical protein BK658_26445 [Pseudomonas brassicacearum]